MGFWGFDISQGNGKGHGHGHTHTHTHRAKNVVEWSSRKALQCNISDQQPKNYSTLNCCVNFNLAAIPK